MRALLAVVVFAVSAPVAANACGMVIRKEQVNLAELMEDVDEAPLVKAERIVVKAKEPAPEPVQAKDASADAQAPASSVEPVQVEPQS